MIVFGSVLVTIIIMYIFLFINLRLQNNNKIVYYDYYVRLVFYCLFMFLPLTIYVILSTVFNMNAFYSSSLLVLVVWGANKFASKCFETSDITTEDKKRLVAISLIGIFLVFTVLKLVDKEVEYNKSLYVVIGIVIGFFVSLDALVEQGKISGLIKAIWNEFMNNLKKVLTIIIPLIALLIIISVAFVTPIFFEEKVQTDVYIGFSIGSLFVLISLFVILKNNKAKNLFNKIFLKNNNFTTKR